MSFHFKTFSILRLITKDICTLKKKYICEGPLLVNFKRVCPPEFKLYKSMCIFAAKDTDHVDYKQSQTQCAKRGSIVLPIKDRGTFEFVRRWAINDRMGDLYIGMNFSVALETPLYSDKTLFEKDLSYDFDDSAGKFGSKECVFLKKGVLYKPRSTDCKVPMHFLCLWKGTLCLNDKYS